MAESNDFDADRGEGGFMRLGQNSKFTIFMTSFSEAEWQSPLT